MCLSTINSKKISRISNLNLDTRKTSINLKTQVLKGNKGVKRGNREIRDMRYRVYGMEEYGE